jgi:hypothetical protein
MNLCVSYSYNLQHIKNDTERTDVVENNCSKNVEKCGLSNSMSLKTYD